LERVCKAEGDRGIEDAAVHGPSSTRSGMRRVTIRPLDREEDVMSASTATPTRPTPSPGIEPATEGSRSDIAASLEAIRSTAGDVGERVPGLVDGVRSAATAGAREVDGWPEPTRRLVAAASLGLGAGLAIAGAPRLVLGLALLPAIAVAATGMARNGPRSA
jgi:hypothetical protein